MLEGAFYFGSVYLQCDHEFGVFLYMLSDTVVLHVIKLRCCRYVVVRLRCYSRTYPLLTLYNLQVTLCTTRIHLKTLYLLPTECVYVFYMDLRTNSCYFPLQY